MALREPRPTTFRIGWHRESTPDGTPSWWAEIGGVKVATAVMTGRAGVDDYPWDWSLTNNGEGMKYADRGKTVGASDTLRSVKGLVYDLLAPERLRGRM